MNRTLSFALAAGLAAASLAATAQAPAAAAPAAVPPAAIPAKIAVIAFEQAVVATNEGQRSVADVQKKYEPKKAHARRPGSNEIDSLQEAASGASRHHLRR